MTPETHVLQRSFADAADILADRIRDAVNGVADTRLDRYLDSCADATTAWGALRLVGADLFAPHLLLHHPLDPTEAGIVAESFARFPTAAEPATHEQRVMAWRDWGTRRLLGSLDGSTPAGATPLPSVEVGTLLGPVENWQRWSVNVAQLSALALPGMDGPLFEAVVTGELALARGVTRAVLRMDYTTAARLARWVALLADAGVRTSLDPILLVDRIRLHAGTGARLRLDVAIARRLLEGARA